MSGDHIWTRKSNSPLSLFSLEPISCYLYLSSSCSLGAPSETGNGSLGASCLIPRLRGNTADTLVAGSTASAVVQYISYL